MFGKSLEHKNALLLKHLLINYQTCPGKELLPENAEEWGSFIDMAYRNRLITVLYHFVICKNCAKITPDKIKNAIQKYYLETILRYRNYQKIKNKLRNFIKQTGALLILLKDLDNRLMRQYYPPYYVPLKMDIDIMGKYEDLPKFRKFIISNGYDQGYQYGYPNKPIPQYKFSPVFKSSMLPQIEFRYEALMIYPSKKNILTPEIIEQFTADLWKNKNRYSLTHHALVCYFEDNCRGLNNLYRVWILANNGQNSLRPIKNLNNVIDFVVKLANREFNNIFSPAKKSGINNALRMVNLDYICRAKLSADKDLATWKDGYVHFLTRGLLAEEPLLQKLLFFAHPKRLYFLFRELIF